MLEIAAPETACASRACGTRCDAPLARARLKRDEAASETQTRMRSGRPPAPNREDSRIDQVRESAFLVGDLAREREDSVGEAGIARAMPRSDERWSARSATSSVRAHQRW